MISRPLRTIFGSEMPSLSFLSSVIMEVLRILFLIGQTLFSLAAIFLLCLIIKTYLIGPYYRKLHVESKGNKEILILGVSAFIFLMLTVILEHLWSHRSLWQPHLLTWEVVEALKLGVFISHTVYPTVTEPLGKYDLWALHLSCLFFETGFTFFKNRRVFMKRHRNT